MPTQIKPPTHRPRALVPYKMPTLFNLENLLCAKLSKRRCLTLFIIRGQLATSWLSQKHKITKDLSCRPYVGYLFLC